VIKIKSLIVDTNNHLNEVFPSFDSLCKELSHGFHLVDTFPDWFSFHTVNQKDTDAKIAYHNKLNRIYKNSLLNLNTMLIIFNDSFKNNITFSISYICRGQNFIEKNIHHAMIITSTEAELFTIRSRINQVIYLQDINHIIIVIDVILTTRHIFDSFIYSYSIVLFFTAFSSISWEVDEVVLLWNTIVEICTK